MKNCEKLNCLPKNVQKKVIDTLKAFTGCYVNLYDDGHYDVSTSVGIYSRRTYYKTIANFDNYEIFTDDEIKKYADEVWGQVDMSQW